MRNWIFLSLLLSGCSAAPWSEKSIPQETIELPIEPLIELDGQSRSQLGALRETALQREPRFKKLLPSAYVWAERPVWARVKDKSVWNGADGFFQCTSQNQSQLLADGPSLDSAFFLNPFLLAGITPHFSCYGGSAADQANWTRSQLPAKITFDGKAHTLLVDYVHHGLMAEYKEPQGVLYNLNLTNAADMGFKFFAVSSKGTRGIVSGAGHTLAQDHLYPLSQSYGTDPIPNSSAHLANLFYGPEVVVLGKLPATLKLAFWRKEDARLGDFPDFFEELRVSNDALDKVDLPLPRRR